VRWRLRKNNHVFMATQTRTGESIRLACFRLR
jgi:hypothetical protein